MKAIVTQLSGRKAVLLRQDGVFVRAANRGYRVGQQISLSTERRRALRPMLAAACLVLVVFSAASVAAWTLPFSYVSVDVNPSLQMTLNWFDRVLSVEAVNEDAQEIVGKLVEEGIGKQPVGNAMQMIYSALEDGDYLTGDADNDVVVAVASYGIKDAKPLAQRLEQMQTVENSGTELSVRTVQVDSDAIAQAREYETTAGKLAIVRPLAQDSPEETREWLQKPVREILSASDDRAGSENGMPPAEPPQTVSGQTAPGSGTPPAPSPTPAPGVSLMPEGSPAPSGSPLPTGSPAPTGSHVLGVSPAPVSSPAPAGSPATAGQQTPDAAQAGLGTPEPEPSAAPSGTANPPTATPKKTPTVTPKKTAPGAAGGQQGDPAQPEPPPGSAPAH